MADESGLNTLKGLHGRASLWTQRQDDLTGLFNIPLAGPGGTVMALLAAPLGCNTPGSLQGLYWSLPHYQGHGITFGATRSGKGVCSIIPTLLTYGASVVVIDPKGENAWVTAERRRQMGHRVVILDPWNEVNRRYASKVGSVETITKFNPLSAIDPRSPDFADDVAAIADALVINTGTALESHWVNSARELISGLVAAVVERAPGKASLRQVRKLLTAPDADLAAAISILVEANPDSLAGRKLRRFTKETAEVSGIRSTAETQTAILDSETLLNAMETDATPFSLAELGTNAISLYLVLPLDRLETHGRWLRLILTMAIRTIARQDTPPPNPVLFMLDEMGTVGPLRMVEQAYGLMAGIGVRIWAFLQDLNQLKRDYPNSWETFISNSSLIQALRVSDISTSDYLSNFMGNTTLHWKSSETTKVHRKAETWGSTGTSDFFNEGDKFLERAVLLPQEIRAINRGQVLNILPELGNYLLARMPYFDRDEWIDCYRPMPGRTMKQRPQPPAPPPPEPKKKGWLG